MRMGPARKANSQHCAPRGGGNIAEEAAHLSMSNTRRESYSASFRSCSFFWVYVALSALSEREQQTMLLMDDFVASACVCDSV